MGNKTTIIISGGVSNTVNEICVRSYKKRRGLGGSGWHTGILCFFRHFVFFFRPPALICTKKTNEKHRKNTLRPYGNKKKSWFGDRQYLRQARGHDTPTSIAQCQGVSKPQFVYDDYSCCMAVTELTTQWQRSGRRFPTNCSSLKKRNVGKFFTSYLAVRSSARSTSTVRKMMLGNSAALL